MGYRLALSSFLMVFFLFLQSQDGKGLPDFFAAYKIAEKLYNAPKPTGKTDSLAFIAYKKTIEILEKSGASDSILFDCYNKAGIISMSAKKDSLALYYFQRSISLKNQSATIADSLLFLPYVFAGNSHYKLLNSDSAFNYYKQAENILQHYPLLNEAERLYNKMGVLYFESGDYKKSVLYFSKALSMVSANPDENSDFIINYKNNIASALRKLQQYDEAISIYKSLLSFKVNTNEIYHNIGVAYLDAGNYPEAIHYLKLVKYINAAKLNDIGRAYYKMNHYDSAQYFFNLALAKNPQTKASIKNLDYGITLKYQGDLASSKNQPAEAIQLYQQSIIQLATDFNDADISRNPVSFNAINRYIFLFDALLAKARVLKSGSAHPGESMLKQSLAAYNSAIELVAHIEKLYDSDESRLFLKQNADSAYHESAALGLQLYTITKEKNYLYSVFNLIENSKASVLQADLRDLELNKIPGLPSQLIQQQKNIKSEIAQLYIQETQPGEHQAKIRDLEIQLSQIQDKLNENPKYHDLKFSKKLLNIPQIQDSLLEKDAAIISYYYSGNQLICFYITNDDFGYVASERDSLLTNNILQLRKALNYSVNSDRETIHKLSVYLYGKFLQPVMARINNKKHLTIIPYNEIGYIPFEMLVDPGKEGTVLNRFAIRYDYSANFLFNVQPANTAYKVLALAPFAIKYSNQEFPPLPFSRDEVKDLEGMVLMDRMATKDSFLKSLPSYPILHLATHAFANDAVPMQSYIAFYDASRQHDPHHRLYEQEIYTLPLSDVRLVILSACETANGQLVNGEGIMSLSRAFSYAGCKSVIASLWKADDAATAYISKHMHKYLAKGEPKDIALQKAKIDYLEDPEIEGRFKTASYWSHLILIGNEQPVTQSSNYILILFACILFIAFMAIVYKRKAVHK
jgi:CHAT domain-containing protein/tetratricopeptide (TPR) repeat protein